MPQCRVCEEQKSEEEFYRQQLRKCGTIGECMECTKKRVKDNRNRRADYYRAYDAKRYQEDPRIKARHRDYYSTDRGKASLRRARQKWVRENPEKRQAQIMVGNAVRDGRLAKPRCCSRCGNTGRIEGHHEDYSKPLDVVWLCRSCHVATHREAEDA